jgi:hypothetical protein
MAAWTAAIAGAAWAEIGPLPSAPAPATAPVVSAPPAAADPPPTPQALARASARADALIAAAHAAAYFDNITHGAEPRVRHKASGLECVFAMDGDAAIAIEPIAGAAPGQGARCTSSPMLNSGDRASVTLRVAPLAGDGSLDQALAAVTADLKRRASQAKPLPGLYPRITLSGGQNTPAPTQKALRFQAAEHGQPTYLRAAAGLTRAWAISQITSAPLDQAGDADLLSEVMLNVALIDVFYAEAASAKAPAQ